MCSKTTHNRCHHVSWLGYENRISFILSLTICPSLLTLSLSIMSDDFYVFLALGFKENNGSWESPIHHANVHSWLQLHNTSAIQHVLLMAHREKNTWRQHIKQLISLKDRHQLKLISMNSDESAAVSKCFKSDIIGYQSWSHLDIKT